ncbi:MULTISPECIES: AraC family transcriptional regulator [unclassified Streptomyces]|uniref:AraC family transcriptional regulator n=1 Tax=unclassified Streptomyces TaxID=2593676 RepID=UPI001BE882C5|nr:MULTISPECIES: AraC family transcriptional regulator [unclassified Streptomyces]MBT2406625.1 AraC family transcriptional regulator [Streptomyces sp. ISL-21]MBT2457341.1 AraC family transcriptional regulator [Streptomyces sp. ISL-86]MBT2613715.1 AraC family transcriptional regulator [Streptomyces sp. ISL-87]
MGRRTITVHHVRAVLAGAARGGIDTVPLLQEAQIPPLLLGDDRARITPAQFARLFRALYRTTQDEFLGLSCVPSRPGTFAMMCHASLGCRDLGAAVERAAAFYGLFPGGPELALEVEGSEARFTVRNDFARDEERFLTECVLAIWHRLSSWLIGRRIPLAYAAFSYPPPPHKDEYEVLFDCPVRFGGDRTEAAFAAHWLTAPLVRDEPALDAMLRRAPFDLLFRPEYGTTVAEQVRRTLTQQLRSSPRLPALGEVAARLAVSPATLRRRLQREGTSFQQLKDHVRRDAAIAGLAESGEPIAELAARLGFSEDTAFHRAFRRWTGTTPGAYRIASGG